VPSISTTVSPGLTVLAAFWMVRQGVDWEPLLLSLPLGEM
jgi:hypothetical protein